MPRKPRPVVLAFASDVHAGGTTALCPERIALDDGGAYEASRAQRWLFQCWEDYWRRVQTIREEHDADLYVVLNGDLVDGDHHNTSQLASRNPNAQAAIRALYAQGRVQCYRVPHIYVDGRRGTVPAYTFRPSSQ